MTEKTEQHTLQRQNLASIDSNYLKLRLDTQDLNKQIFHFLSGTQVIVEFDDETDQYYEKIDKIGEPLANAKGRAMLCQAVAMIVNPHTIQGNTERDEFKRIMFDLYRDLTEGLTNNYTEWGIEEQHRGFILENIDRMVRLIISRTIDNKEREGLTIGVERTSQYYEDKKQKRGLF